ASTTRARPATSASCSTTSPSASPTCAAAPSASRSAATCCSSCWGRRARGARRWLETAVAISVPYDLAAGADHLERSAMGRFYRRRFVRSLQRKLEAKRALVADEVDLHRALRARTFREFDDAATAPLHGFADAAEYYRLSSSARYLEAIRIPTLLLHAEDDPFLPPHALPREAIARNPYLVPVITSRGGHVGFIGGPPWAPRFWAEAEAGRLLAARPADGGGRPLPAAGRRPSGPPAPAL